LALKLVGRVISGKGLGIYFVSLEEYRTFFKRILDREIFCGTLNIELNRGTWRDLPLKIYMPEGPHAPILFARGKIFSEDIIVLRPVKSTHPDNVIEIVAGVNLRKKYQLNDGDCIVIEIVD